ncbi:MAG: gluconate kinase [Robiginitomaculum sp.]|nr:MAG: gluconate kinase [Robiginitomaculum sp.]
MQNLMIIMGVSGCGKSTISQAFGTQTGWPVLEGDAYHPQSNVEKMAGGAPLTDQDRAAWLDALNQAISTLPQNAPVILACSALTPYVRDRLQSGTERTCHWIWLDAPQNLIQTRIDARKDHFMPPALLQSQFNALTAPADALRIDAAQSPQAIITDLLSAFSEHIS